jgi:hypothetical protein
MFRWYRLGNCSNQPNLNHFFFSEKKKDLRVAKAICKGCPVKANCFLEGVGEFGVWAGLATEQREMLLALWGFPKGAELRAHCYKWFGRQQSGPHISSQDTVDTTIFVLVPLLPKPLPLTPALPRLLPETLVPLGS